jgi:hypothetical protein
MGKGESKLIHMIPLNILKSYQEEYRILGLTRNDICFLHNIFRDIQNYPHNRKRSQSQQSQPQSPSQHQQRTRPGRQIDEETEEEVDDTETIKLEKLFEYFSIEKTSFTKLLFMSFDIDLFVLDEIDFPRFVQAIWNFCSLDDEALSKSYFCAFLIFHLPYFLSSLLRRLLCLQSLRCTKRRLSESQGDCHNYF